MSDKHYVIERKTSDGVWIQTTFHVSSSVFCGYHLFKRRCDAEACLVIYLSGKRIDESMWNCKDIRKTKTFAHVLSKRNVTDALSRCSERYRVSSVSFNKSVDDPLDEYAVCESFL